MTASPLGKVVRQLRRAAGGRWADGLDDGQLLERFLTHDEAAFGELVRRHGPMVLGVCRRVLRHEQDAEDAFQATFLVLVRRASSVRPRATVGNFLYGVARRTAQEARRAAVRRRAREARAVPRERHHDDVFDDTRRVLDRELSRLPDSYRMPLILCDLEGLTQKEAAGRLGWPEGTVASRLSRGRALLARRLKGTGLVLSAGLVAVSVPSTLTASTVEAGCRVAGGLPAGLSAGVTNLTERVLRGLTMSNLKVVLAVVLGLAVLTGGLGLGAWSWVPSASADDVLVAGLPPTKPAREPADKGGADKGPATSVKELPPAVVKTVPQAGDTQVDAAKTTEIRVTFSKDMMDKSWSFAQTSEDTFPKTNGDIFYDKDKKTCVMPVKLEPGKTYVIWVNSAKFGNFKDADGRSAVPYLLVFETKP